MTQPDRRRDANPTHDIVVDDRSVSVSIRRSPRATRYTLRLAPTGELVLTLPARANLERGLAFAEAQRGWIRSRLGRLPETVVFADGATIPLRGVPHEIRHAGRGRGTVWTSAQDGVHRIHVAGAAEHLPRRLGDWLKAEARADLDAAVAVHARALGVHWRRLTVRDQTSRWGSCSAAGALSFSWRLIMAPPFVLDYLAAHEVTHLVEMNHGARFWRTLERIAPHTDRAEAWLKRNGASLHRYRQKNG